MDRKRILVVDDDSSTRYACERYLEKDYDVWLAENANQGLTFWNDRTYHLILLDLKMPGLDAMEFLKMVKKHHPDCPVVVITGYGSTEVMRNVMQEGADGYLDKPFGAEDLGGIVKKIMEGKSAFDQRLNKLNGKKILVVDDEIDIVDYFAAVLKSRGCVVFKARRGMEALDIIDKEKPDLVFLDIMLPDIDGLEVCRKTKEKKSHPSLPVVVMITSRVRKEYKTRAKEAGADLFLSKPINPQQIIETVESYLK